MHCSAFETGSKEARAYLSEKDRCVYILHGSFTIHFHQEDLPLLRDALGKLERVCKVPEVHPVMAPLLAAIAPRDRDPAGGLSAPLASR